MKIKTKLMIFVAILLVFAVMAFNIFLGIQLSTSAENMFNSYLSDMSKVQALNLKGYFEDIENRFTSILKLPAIQTFTSGNYKESSGEYKAAKAAFTALVESGTLKKAVVFDNEENVKLQVGADDSITNARGICMTGAENNVPVVYVSEADTSKSDYAISIKTVVNNYNVGLVFSGTGVSRVIEQASATVFVIAPDGVVITEGNSMANSTGQYKAYLDQCGNASDTPLKVVFEENTGYITSCGNGWYVGSSLKASNAFVNSGSAAGSVTGISVTLLVVFLVVAIILIITVTKPFYKIEETLLKISRGDHEARVEIMSKNEYGEIARVFNDIVDEIIVSEARYRTIIEMSDNIIFDWNLNNNEVAFSNNFNKKFSYRAPSDHFSDSFLLKCKVHPEDVDRYREDLEKLPKGVNFKHNEYRIKNIYGDYIWVLIRTATICDKDGNPVKIVGVIVDIDRAKKSENILTARASFDSLTGVYNRETIESAINNEIELIAARKNEFAILFVDIDDFKFFNDQYSHATGDQVLRFTATTIKNAIGDYGMAGRYGGDEFIVCIKDADNNDPALIAEQILNTLKEGFESDSGDRLSVNVSIGISIIKDNTKRVEEIIGMADDAMYKIKKSGKSNFGFLES